MTTADDTRHWIRITGQATNWLLPLTRRDDVIADVRPGCAGDVPARFLPETAEIHIDPEQCQPGADPADIDLGTPAGRYTHPALAGAARHEAGHAAHTHWTIDQTPPMRTLMETALLLEEPAMEKDVITTDPDARTLLRASFATIVDPGGNPDPDTPAAAAHLACLAHGRADAGILTTTEIQPIIDHCTSIIGADRYQQLRQVWLDVQALPTPRTDTTAMTAHAQRWLDILGPDAPTGTGTAAVIPICGTPDNNNDDGTVAGTVAGTIARIGSTAEREAGTAAEQARAAERARERDAAAATAAQDTDAARRTFTRTTAPRSGGWGDEGITGTRPPTVLEHGEASRLARALRAAQYRDRTTTTTDETAPPGRMRSREAVRRSAETALGLPPTARPFQRRTRRRTPQPPIRAGIGCDISGSMRNAAADVASAAWTIAQAVHRNDGDSATIAYGNTTHPVVRPGETPRSVREFRATGGTENFTEAVRALTGALDLANPGAGARLLVIISDGRYTTDQYREGQALIDRLAATGTRILWLGFNGPTTDRPMNNTHYHRLRDPAAIGATIGGAMTRILTTT